MRSSVYLIREGKRIINSLLWRKSYPELTFYNIDIEKTLDFLHKETYKKGGFTYNKKTHKRISAILPVHMYGNAVDIKPIKNICKDMNIKIIEDASESLGTFYRNSYLKGKHTGCIGDIGCISFNGNKIITSGGGGMILTNKKKVAEKAKYLSTQAKDDPVRYIHNDIGYNFRITNIQAAVGLAQMEQLKTFLDIKRNNYKFYKNAIMEIDGLEVSEVPQYSINNHWMVLLKIDDKIYKRDREELMSLFSSNGIQTRPAWAPIHLQKPYSNYQNYKITLANELVDKSLCIPASTNINLDNMNEVVNVLK